MKAQNSLLLTCVSLSILLYYFHSLSVLLLSYFFCFTWWIWRNIHKYTQTQIQLDVSFFIHKWANNKITINLIRFMSWCAYKSDPHCLCFSFLFLVSCLFLLISILLLLFSSPFIVHIWSLLVLAWKLCVFLRNHCSCFAW